MKNCKTCDYCKRFYDRYYRHGKRRQVCCTARDEITRLENSCEKWRKKVRQYDLSPRRFDEVQEDIKTLMELLKEV